MGKRVALAPRNSAEAVALGVSACFLAVAGVVVHGDAATERALQPTITNLAAVEVRTVSRPSQNTLVRGSRVPVLAAAPPLVLLPVQDQAAAKVAAEGTVRGEGLILVAYSRGAGTLSVGGGLSGIVVASTPTHLSGAVGFPTSTTATAAPGPATPPPSAGTPTASGPTTAPPATATAPPTSGPTAPPTPEPTTPTTPPTTEPTTPPTTDPTPPPSTEPGSGSGDGGGTGSTGDATTGTGGGGTDGGTNGVADEVGTAAAPEAEAATVPGATVPGPTPESGGA